MSFGADLSAVPVLGSLKSGNANLAEALLRRLSTPRGGLFYAPDYGLDVRKWLNESFDPQREFELLTLLRQEIRKDPRIEDAQVQASKVGNVINIKVLAYTATGPFELVLAVSAVNVEVLRADNAN